MRERKSLITFNIIMFLLSGSISLFQNFIFNIVNKSEHVTFRFNCCLQIFSIFNFLGSFFWTYIADKKKNHNQIFVLNSFIYGFCVFCLLFFKDIKNEFSQILIITLLTICREFTLGSFLPIIYALILNFCTRKHVDTSYIGISTIFYNFGTAFAMFIAYLIAKCNFEKNALWITLGIYFIFVIIISILMLMIAPKYEIIVEDLEKYQNQIENLDKNIQKLIKKPSLISLYFVITVSGIFKCIIINFLATFFEMNNISDEKIKMLFTIRSVMESISFLVLSVINLPYFLILNGSLIISALSICLNILYINSIRILVISEIMKGLGRSFLVFSSILIFSKHYSTPKTTTQVQGLRNSAYNGLSCILIGILSLLFIPSDLVDYRNLKAGKQNQMKNKIINLFSRMYKSLFYLLLFTVLAGLLSQYFVKKNI